MIRRPNKSQSLACLVRRGFPIRAVLDVGVLTGTLELRDTFPSLTHFLFEPVVEFKQAIEENYQNLSYELITAAVADSSGSTRISVTSKIEGSEVTHSTIDEFAGDRVVPVISLDDFVSQREIPKPYLLKIDIDGLEMLVLQGALHTLKDVSVLVIEATLENIIERVSFLIHRGFVIFDLSEPTYYDDAFWQCDVIMIKSELKSSLFKDIAVNFDAQLYSPYIDG